MEENLLDRIWWKYTYLFKTAFTRTGLTTIFYIGLEAQGELGAPMDHKLAVWFKGWVIWMGKFVQDKGAQAGLERSFH